VMISLGMRRVDNEKLAPLLPLSLTDPKDEKAPLRASRSSNVQRQSEKGDSLNSCFKTHQRIHQWNTVRSVPKPNVFGTPKEEASASRLGGGGSPLKGTFSATRKSFT
jgi:hypothetical protein